ncbi:hypothetical protein [Chryseobacterium echinoideorum]|uniref:hypothetical protein n=1 Tax=Chryseobacterium echinoideorum TaxID=1549648 RepID=UPI001186B27E|nr:hypothetical protein [Chryseobacterium echinoideorum]
MNINLRKNITISFPELKFFLFAVFLNLNLFLSAQQSFDNHQKITLHGDVKIYSSDKYFNEKVVSGYIDEEYNLNGKNVVVFNGINNTVKEKYDLKKNVKAAKEKRNKLAFKEIKKKIDDFEKRKESFDFHHLRGCSSSEDFLSLSRLLKDSATTFYSYHLLKTNCIAENYIIKISLEFLHDSRFHYYNNKSLDYCFSEVFSVRPPPAC